MSPGRTIEKNGAGWRIRTADLLITKRQPKHSLIN